jgi:hypothetical protein
VCVSVCVSACMSVCVSVCVCSIQVFIITRTNECSGCVRVRALALTVPLAVPLKHSASL